VEAEPVQRHFRGSGRCLGYTGWRCAREVPSAAIGLAEFSSPVLATAASRLTTQFHLASYVDRLELGMIADRDPRPRRTRRSAHRRDRAVLRPHRGRVDRAASVSVDGRQPGASDEGGTKRLPQLIQRAGFRVPPNSPVTHQCVRSAMCRPIPVVLAAGDVDLSCHRVGPSQRQDSGCG
jgi:hypothetical protein